MDELCEDCTACETKDQTGLLSAALHGHQKCVEVWIASGADVNKHDEYDDTAMKLAAQHGHLKCVDNLFLQFLQ